MVKAKPSINKLARPLAVVTLLGLVVALVLVGPGQQGSEGGDFPRYNNKQFRVSRVIDGDTIDLAIPDGDQSYTRVRLWGVDTPETKSPGKPVSYFGPEATAFTEEMVAGRTVRIELEREKTRGKFGRLLGFVYSDEGKMLNEELLRSGHAYALLRSGHAYADGRWRHRFYFRFGQIEKQARKNKRGLWGNVKAQDMPRHVRKRLGISK